MAWEIWIPTMPSTVHRITPSTGALIGTFENVRHGGTILPLPSAGGGVIVDGAAIRFLSVGGTVTVAAPATTKNYTMNDPSIVGGHRAYFIPVEASPPSGNPEIWSYDSSTGRVIRMATNGTYLGQLSLPAGAGLVPIDVG